MSMTSEAATNMQPGIEAIVQTPQNNGNMIASQWETENRIPPLSQLTTNQSSSQPKTSYASVSNTGAISKKQKIFKPRPYMIMQWTDQIRQILTYHNQGARILILMRGAPGSGKSYLAKQIVEITIGSTFADYMTHICSTDDFFMARGIYQFEKYRLPEAHDWNQNRVKLMLRQGLSPVIVDNTNIEVWEMEPYLREGVRNGYIIEVIEPNTPWARKANQLIKRNVHNVPYATIKRILENYQTGVTGEYLIKTYGLSYPANMVPPIMRNMPAVTHVLDNTTQLEKDEKIKVTINECATVSNALTTDVNSLDLQQTELSSSLPSRTFIEKQEETQDNHDELSVSDESTPENDAQEDRARQKRQIEIEKQLEELERVEHEWENGESWDEGTQEQKQKPDESHNIQEPKPPRVNDPVESTLTEMLLDSVKHCNDWRQISMFMPPWTNDTPKEAINVPEMRIETKCSSTCVETGDTDFNKANKTFKIKTATPRDINFFHFADSTERIPEKRMLDKSTMTNELLITAAYRCKNEEKHFVAFRKLFKNIPKAALRDVFDKCCGDVNWAVDIILGGMANNELEIIDDDNLSDNEEEDQELCDCLAAYNVIPDKTAVPSTSTKRQDIPETKDTVTISLPQKKGKAIPSDSTVQLKRQIEKNFTIAENHYSPHCLKIRKIRRGEYNPDQEHYSEIPNTELQNSDDALQPSTSKAGDTCCYVDSSDDEASVAGISNDREKTVNINLGMEFLSELDNMFGRKDMTYPENVLPRINIPVSLLNEINAYWMESLMSQLDEQDKQTARMIKEDEEFAR